MLNPKRFNADKASIHQRFFAATRTFVDRMHFPGHVDWWCRCFMNANQVHELQKDKINTQVRCVTATIFHGIGRPWATW